MSRFLSLFLDAVARGEQRFGAVVEPHGACKAALCTACTRLHGLHCCRYALVLVAPSQWSKELLIFATTRCARLQGGCVCGTKVRLRGLLVSYLGTAASDRIPTPWRGARRTQTARTRRRKYPKGLPEPDAEAPFEGGVWIGWIKKATNT